MLEKMRAFWRGRVCIAGRGKNPAAFLNEALRHGLVLFHTQRSETGLKAQMSVEDFRRIRSAARASHTRIRVIAKYGWPFILARWRRRKGLLGGMALIAAVVIVLSQMILVISVSGNKNVPTPILLENAAALGLKTGMWQKNADLNEIAAQLRDETPDAAWIGVRRQGVRVTIHIVEKVRPQIPSAAGNLVAAKSGLIQDIMVIQGTPLVHEGETVRAGQQLIIQDWTNQAKGFVRGRVWYSAEMTVPLQEDKLEESGKAAEGWGIKFGARVIMVTTPESPFPEARQEERSYRLGNWRNWRFPVEVIHMEYYELQQVHRERTVTEARQAAETQARAEVYAELPAGAKVVEEKVKALDGVPGTETIRVEVETYEDLAVYAGA
ncbi:MAG: sporulation protein YqfD [Peptococcaceae bacterium]|jgi:similar to stage IV sporulation protein|nr:sporulation protein YqfD [Peptococcaceae bacterium]